jgi:hypothetical protein
VQEELNGSSPALEIPEWMFDSGHCSGMKQDSLASVSSAALRALTILLSPAVDPIESSALEAQHLYRSSGDADAQEAIQDQPRRVICSTGEAAGVPPEARQKMIHLFARMLNEHLQKHPLSGSSRQREVGDE